MFVKSLEPRISYLSGAESKTLETELLAAMYSSLKSGYTKVSVLSQKYTKIVHKQEDINLFSYITNR